MQSETTERKEKEFLAAAAEVGKKILTFEDAVIVHHFDSDGVPGGAIVFSAMVRNGIAPAMQCWKKVTVENLDQLAKTTYKQIIFDDIGTGQLKLLEQKLPNREIIIIDHHEPELKIEDRKPNFTIINPHDYGLQGATEACSAVTSYFCFRDYKDLTQPAIVGAVGDVQAENGMQGINKVLLRDAVEAGICEVKQDLKLFGRSSRSLISFLSYCSDPFLPGLSGNDKNCARFLMENEIPTREADKTLAYFDLSEENRKKLASALIEYAFANGVEEEAVKQMVGEIYLFPHEQRGSPFYDSHEFAVVMNACGRNNAAEIGVRAALGEKEARLQAEQILLQHRTNLRQGILLGRTKVADIGPYYLIDLRGQVKDSIIGTVCNGVLHSTEQAKPLLGIANDEEDVEMVKISTRGTKKLLNRGLNLNLALRFACADLGKSIGGGHNVAAGASVEKRFLPEFLERFADAVRNQTEQVHE